MMRAFWRGWRTTNIRICVAGATGRMGSTLIREAVARGFKIVGAIAARDDPNIDKTLREAGVCDLNVKIVDPSRIPEAVKEADVYVSFTTPEAEVANLPLVADLGKRIVMGTTGFTSEQMRKIVEAVSSKVPAVFSPNYAIGVNILFKLLRMMKAFPEGYDFSIVEIHHSGKKDAPSGTAKKMGEIISEIRGYSSISYGREGISPRKPGELEVLAVRAGGVPGIHEVIIAGSHEIIRIEHTAFSRSVFAQGALYAVNWIYKQEKPGIYTMDDVLGGV
ncbi:MAG: 4-hydroxy-tetrahydrodipicolinate reductase [Candidatus Bathyarchaeota archaeon]|nr:4-hydroxy-tetrahydrodipicolinate reductase [Candidatus Bathyarchaeota archaeon]